jgi:hypothetical protein
VAAVVPQAVYSLLAGLFVHTTHSPVPAAGLFRPVRHWAHTCTFPLSIAVVFSRSVPAPHGVQAALALLRPVQAPGTPWPSGHSTLFVTPVTPTRWVWPSHVRHTRAPPVHSTQKPAPQLAPSGAPPADPLQGAHWPCRTPFAYPPGG